MVATLCMLASLVAPQPEALVAQLAKEHRIKVLSAPLIARQSQEAGILGRAFPIWSQSQMGETAQQITHSSRRHTGGFVDFFNRKSADLFFEHIDPKTQSKVETMAAQLAKNPDFNNPENLSRMLTLVLPMKHLGIGN